MNANQVSFTGVILNIVVAGLVATDNLMIAGICFLAAGLLDIRDGVHALLALLASFLVNYTRARAGRISRARTS